MPVGLYRAEVIPRESMPLVPEGILTGRLEKMIPGVVTASPFSR